jgi:hypothetical protein
MGFEVREDLRTTVSGNNAFNNTAGIFESIMPGDPLERSLYNTISENRARDNNRPNKRVKPSDPVCLISPEVGIAAVGGANNLNLRTLDRKGRGNCWLDDRAKLTVPPSLPRCR